MNLSSLATHLLAPDDPVQLLFQALNEVWAPQGSADLDPFYAQQERETNHLEEFIRDTYFELYDVLLERARSQNRAAEFSSLDASIVVLDGLSIREANWLMPRLRERGYEIADYSYAFSGMPSTTQTFFRDVFGVSGAAAMPKKWQGFNFRSIRSGDVPAFMDGPKALVWLSFPDELMHPMRGKGVTPSFALQRTEEALLKILNLLETPEVVLTSDHGYIYAQSAALFWHAPISNRKVLLKLFGAQRGLPADSAKAQEFEGLRALPKDQTYVLFDDKGCYVRGRYYWSAPGKQSDVAHGGISLMECLVPVVKVRRG
ncbi:MAG: hypothetical protein M1136_10355 [Chloroflexi bacterium]|nr:hypothetical protein [Chloroflexota bacterium]MCL5076032.1 hypothetical protein [Chloroflexota bacterium]